VPVIIVQTISMLRLGSVLGHRKVDADDFVAVFFDPKGSWQSGPTVSLAVADLPT